MAELCVLQWMLMPLLLLLERHPLVRERPSQGLARERRMLKLLLQVRRQRLRTELSRTPP